MRPEYLPSIVRLEARDRCHVSPQAKKAKRRKSRTIFTHVGWGGRKQDVAYAKLPYSTFKLEKSRVAPLFCRCFARNRYYPSSLEKRSAFALLAGLHSELG